jgi:NAD(P)-dependent dehydrogenase (short-subunit alcohol dehydrogenase family)
LREQKSKHALIVGASGGVGAALLSTITSRGLAGRVSAWSRPPLAGRAPLLAGVDWSAVDLRDEKSIADAALRLGEVDLVVVATGILHAAATGASHRSMHPEKTWRAIDPEMMTESFIVNTIGPALVAKHVLPLFPPDRRAVFAALSARVGSIGDNRLGGWYSYRASKAALNQIIRTLSIELAAKHPLAICVGLHPGTVATGLSQPFRGNVPAGRLTAPDEAAAKLLDVISGLSPGDTGSVFDTQGMRVPD